MGDIHFYFFLTQIDSREAYIANQSPQLKFSECSLPISVSSKSRLLVSCLHSDKTYFQPVH